MIRTTVNNFSENEPEMKEDNSKKKRQERPGEIIDLVEQLVAEIELRKQVEKALAGRLEFEQLLSSFSSRFVNIPLDRVDMEIEHALKGIYEFFGCDRCALLAILPDKAVWKITHVAAVAGVPPVPVGVELPAANYPWSYEKLVQKREIMSFSRLDDLPSEANVEKQYRIEWGIRSALSIPIVIDGSVKHVINLNSSKSECVWPDELIPKLQIIGEVFVNALERKRIRRQLEEQLYFEGLISSLSSDFVNLPIDKIDCAINASLHSIAEFLQVDRCSIGLFDDDATRLVRAFDYHTAESEPAPESLVQEQMPWYLEQLRGGKSVIMNRIEDFPPVAEMERRFCLVKGIKSLLA